MRRRRRRKHNTFARRLVRSALAIVILTAFVLAVVFSVKELASMNATKIAKLSHPILARLNIHVNDEQVGEVAGKFVERIVHTGKVTRVSPEVSATNSTTSATSSTTLSDSPGEISSVVKYKVALLADSEDNFDNLRVALHQAKEMGVDVALFLGDLTSFGEKSGLEEGKDVLNSSGLVWYALPGDHDLAASDPVGPGNFLEVFKVRHQVVHVGDYKLLLLDNSANYTPLDEEDMNWFSREIEGTDFVILAQPLYHPTLDVVMGRVDGETIAPVRGQAEELLRIIRGFPVKAIISADQHMFGHYPDEVLDKLQHYVVGALADQSLERNPLGPHFSVLTIFADDSFEVENVKLLEH